MKKGFAPILVLFIILIVFSSVLFIKNKFFAIPREVTINGTVTTNYLPQNPDDYASFVLKKDDNSKVEVLYQQGKNSCANKESEKLGATLNSGDKVEVRGMDYGTSVQICSFAKYYIRLLEKGPAPTPEPSQSPIPNQGSHVTYQLDFVASSGLNKKLVLYSNSETQKLELYLPQSTFNPKKDTKVVIANEIFDFGLQTPIQASPGKKKFFYIKAMAGDTMATALLDEDGKVINNVERNVENAIVNKFGEKYFNLSSDVKQWNDSNSLIVDFARFAQSDHYYQVELLTDGSVKNIEQIKNK